MRYTIKQFNKDFPDDNACLEYMFKARFGNSTCPKCNKTSFYRIKSRKCYACACGYQIHPTTDTIFHKSSTSLKNWFFAIYLMSKGKNGVSAKELERHLGITYKTAWRMAHKIRTLMKDDSLVLSGVVEVDEMYVGGRRRGQGRGRCGSGKTPVFGMVSRNGKSKAKVVEEVETKTILKIIKDNIKVGSRIISDEMRIYPKVKKLGYSHSSVKHSAKEYVRGRVYTNSIEGFWSQIKRSIHGTYHSVSVKHLQSYIDEFSYRYNHRFSDASLFQTLLSRLCVQHDLRVNKSVSLLSRVFS